MIRSLLGKINETVRELWLGILIWTLAWQIVPVWFMKEAVSYSLGLWLGALLALGASYHMWWALERGLEDAGSAQKYIGKQAVIRYLVIVAAFAVIMITQIANPLSAFAGIMGLKAAAYMQPFLHRRLHGGKKEREEKEEVTL